MKIGELSRQVGVDIETIRYYEKIGLLRAPPRSANGYRAYDETQLAQLAFIRHCRALDIPLSETARLLAFLATPDAGCDEVNALIDAHLAKIHARLASLQALERQLHVLRARCASPHVAGDCGILKELVAAAHGESCVCHALPPTNAPSGTLTGSPQRKRTLPRRP